MGAYMRSMILNGLVMRWIYKQGARIRVTTTNYYTPARMHLHAQRKLYEELVTELHVADNKVSYRCSAAPLGTKVLIRSPTQLP